MIDHTTAKTSPESRAVRPEPIRAKPLRHPGRWVAAVVVAGLLLWFVISALNNENYGWDVYRSYLFDTRIINAAGHTLALTVLSMLFGVILGSVTAVMRMSPNIVLKSVAWLYLWIFRGTPIYVQLVFWGLAGSLYQSINLGFAEIDLQSLLSNMFVLAVIGLSLNEGAYMSEIVRSGIQAVPEGQVEASQALGMGWWLTMRRTILPQAMRIIIPPTGNELISMLKTTSLVVAIPYSLELYGRSLDIANALFDPVPMLLVAATWYLAITSVLMIGQHYLEEHFNKGVSRELTPRQLAALADAEGDFPSNITLVNSADKERRNR
ncbi:amino acid ABC transporter permease [Auritidibacter ignavus]|uniref:amino acid ABC transporter permease n=1 Tax=Auritidibacter ignavus TaxID=678932 RepID=UPI00109D36A3|nr:amino acid ABC transporter permease [Auritidibacter ignavus]